MIRRSHTLLFSSLVLALCAPLASSCSRQREPLPVLATVPAFSLTSSEGQIRRETDLKGSLWVADFIFTQCPGVCPLLTAQMARLQTALAHEGLADVRLVSFSVDPAHDTPAALQKYAKLHRADTQAWWFLTGDRDSLYTLIGKGFLLAVAERSPDPQAETQELITHSDRFVLVDRDLQVRGYYRPLEEDGLQKLLADLRRLHFASPTVGVQPARNS